MARPKSNRWVDADEAIGHACAQLMHWGLSGPQVFATIAAAADRVFGRRVGPDRVKQIYRRWTGQARPLGYRDPGAFTKASRVRHGPQGPIETLAERLLREHRPGSLQKRVRMRQKLAEAERRVGQFDSSGPSPGPDPLDEPRWFAVGAGTHPDDMSDAQRAAFEALPRHVQEEYRALIDKDARQCKKEEADSRHLQGLGPLVKAAFEPFYKEVADGVYAPPGMLDDLERTPKRGGGKK